MTITRIPQPLKWAGGKSYLAADIIQLMPPHLHYVETHAGGLAVLLERDPTRDWLIDDAWKKQNGDKVPAALKGCSEVVNDLNSELTNFWRVLQDEEAFPAFRRQVEAMPFSDCEWRDAEQRKLVNDIDVNHAVRFFVRCRQSRAGSFKGFASITRNRTRRGINEQASAWLSCIDGLPEVHARLRSVVILNDDATAVIHQQDGANTLFYLDPPYMHETRATTDHYDHEMAPEQHAELLEALAGIKGKFILSGYSCPLYEQAEKRYGWHRVEFRVPNQMAGGAAKRVMIEVVWMNY
jgi:DNA adenine methylase